MPTAKKTAHNTDVKAPARMPRPAASEVGEPEGDLDSAHLSPLGIYLKNVAKISLGAFSRAIGVSQKTVSEWATGKGMPQLVAAYEIERLTKGVVPMESWLGLPQAKSLMAELRSKQPEGLAKQKSYIPAGGFAAPPEKVNKGKK